jgi:hypothetical protein
MKQDRETPVQVAIVQWLKQQFPAWLVHHCKMEINKRGKAIQIEIAKAKRKGSKPGFPDLLVLPWAHLGPLFFEVKAEGNYASPAQKDMHARLTELGYRVAVVRSIDDVQEYLGRWGIQTFSNEKTGA